MSVVDLGCAGRPDTFHLKKASEANAVILTRDADFLKTAHGSGVRVTSAFSTFLSELCYRCDSA